MAYLLEVYYRSPPDPKREEMLRQRVAAFGGRLDYREEPDGNGMGSVVLSYEFDNLQQAAAAARALREQGEHVEGPGDYG